jgi:hypothetical protein
VIDNSASSSLELLGDTTVLTAMTTEGRLEHVAAELSLEKGASRGRRGGKVVTVSTRHHPPNPRLNLKARNGGAEESKK